MIKGILKTIIDNRKIGRMTEIYSDDIMIVSYPKSGNTWMRFLLGNILYKKFDFTNMEKLIPDLYVVNNGQLKTYKRPRIIKSHEYFDPRYKKVIYIVRDPRSVAVSYFYFLKKIKIISDDLQFADYLDNFLNGKYDSFATWSENVESWICAKSSRPDEFLLIKYEDLKLNTFKEMQKILSFLNIKKEPDAIKKAISKSSFSSMKKNEKENFGKIKVFKNSNKDIPFVRAGNINEWQKYFDENLTKKIINHFGKTMKKLGYQI